MDPRASYHDFVRSDVFPLLPEHVGTVLDFGGGIGATSAALRQAGRADRAVLFDQVADNALGEIDSAEPMDLNDLDRLGAALDQHGPFDTVLCLDILEHLIDPWAIVNRLHSAIRPGGIMIISLPNMNSKTLVGPLLLRGRFDYDDAGVRDRTHLRWFTLPSAIKLATSSGLVLEGQLSNIPGRKYKLLNRATLGLFERFLAEQYVMRARKAA